MADLSVYVKGQPESIDAVKVVEGLKYLLEALDDLAPHTHGWRFSRLALNSIDTAIAPRLAEDAEETVGAFESMVAGIRVLEHRPQMPPGWTLPLAKKLKGAAECFASASTAGAELSVSGRDATVLTRRTVDNVRRLDQIKRHSIGSVVGRLERLNLHDGANDTTLYEDGRGTGIKVSYGYDLHADVIEALRTNRRVRVRGRLTRKVDGEITRIRANTIHLLPEPDTYPSLADAAGAFPNFTGGQNAVDYIRGLREA
ncbi:hypothetical protein [Gordonia terrae]